ncbi:hypothetical protein ACOSQ4_032155 [Xanthoceras sorbifolium]
MDLLVEFEENKVKQIHIIVQYLPLNVIHPEPNHESNFEPNNEHGPEPNPEQGPEPNPKPNPEHNHEPNPEPNNSPNIEPNNPQLNNQYMSQSNQPNQPTPSSDSDLLYEGLINDSESSNDKQFDSDKEGGNSYTPNQTKSLSLSDLGFVFVFISPKWGFHKFIQFISPRLRSQNLTWVLLRRRARRLTGEPDWW